MLKALHKSKKLHQKAKKRATQTRMLTTPKQQDTNQEVLDVVLLLGESFDEDALALDALLDLSALPVRQLPQLRHLGDCAEPLQPRLSISATAPSHYNQG